METQETKNLPPHNSKRRAIVAAIVLIVYLIGFVWAFFLSGSSLQGVLIFVPLSILLWLVLRVMNRRRP